MALLEELFEGEVLGGPWSAALVGVGAVLFAPVVAPMLGGVLRSIIKAAIKGGLIAYDATRETVEHSREWADDLVAEARQELGEGGTKTTMGGEMTRTEAGAMRSGDATRDEPAIRVEETPIEGKEKKT